MPRRRKEPEEALGPAIDGMDQLARLELALRPATVEEDTEEICEALEPEPEDPQVILLFGQGERETKVAGLGRECGFRIEVAARAQLDPDDNLASLADAVHIIGAGDDLVTELAIGRNHFICIFIDDAQECENILFQCLHSDAAYIGVWAGKDLRREVFTQLSEDGIPDAELQAICCPMGLGIGGKTPEQDAVAVLAEIMAARSGALKRLRLCE